MATKAKSPAEDSFVRKVVLLENAVMEGKIPPEWPSITKITDLRDWEAKPLGLTSWKSNSIHARSGPYAPVRARFEAILPLLLEIRGNKSTKKTIVRRSDVERILREQVKRLAIQNEDLFFSVQKLEREVAILNERLAAANKKLNTIAPISRNARDV